MKTKTFAVSPETGSLFEVGAFSKGLNPLEVEATNKTEATARILAKCARQAAAGSPVLFVRNGAYCLATHNGEGWSAEAGTIHPSRQQSDGSLFPLCSGGFFDRAKDAVKHASFDYYASDVFQRAERVDKGPVTMVEEDLRDALRGIDAAYDKAARHGHSIPSELAFAIMAARSVLASYGWTQPVEAAQAAGAI